METVALEGDGKQMRWNGNGEKRAKIVWKPFPTSLSTASQFPALGEIFSLCFSQPNQQSFQPCLLILLESIQISRKQSCFCPAFRLQAHSVRHLTTCLPTDSENRPAVGIFLSWRANLFGQLACRLHRFLAWKAVIVRSFDFSSCSVTSALAMPRSIFTAALCRISSVTWE